MEAVSLRQPLPYRVLRLAACVEVWIDGADCVEDIMRLVAVDLTLFVVRFERVALDDEQRVVVVRRYLRRFPSEQVHIYMPVPLRNHTRLVAVYHADAVEYDNDRIVSLVRASANVHNSEIAVCDNLVRHRFWQVPYLQHALSVLREAQVLQGFFALVPVCVDISD